MDFGFYVLLFFYLSRCRTIFLVSRLIFFFSILFLLDTILFIKSLYFIIICIIEYVYIFELYRIYL